MFLLAAAEGFERRFAPFAALLRKAGTDRNSEGSNPSDGFTEKHPGTLPYQGAFWQRVKDSNGASHHSLLAPQSSEPIEIVRVRIPRTALQKNTLVLYRTKVFFGSG